MTTATVARENVGWGRPPGGLFTWGLAAAVGLHLLIAGLASVAPGWSAVQHQAHASLEIAGAVIAIFAAFVLAASHRQGSGGGLDVWISGALMGMGVLDGMHALTQGGRTFVWLHCTGTLAGGLLMAAVWLPLSWQERVSGFWHWTVGSLAALFGTGSLILSSRIPALVESTAVAPLASILNFTGGMLFFAAAFLFGRSYRRSRATHHALACLLCIYFGGAATLFVGSHLWGAAWWGWHFIRLFGYGLGAALASVGVYSMFQTSEAGRRALRSANEELEKHARELDEQKAAAVRNMEEALEAKRRAEEAEDEMRVMTAELATSSYELGEFVYIASHDLRAPLQAIKSLSRWIEEDLEESFTDETREQMRLLRGRVARMETLLGDLREYASTGREEVAVEEVDVGEMVERVVELLELPLGFTVTVAGELPSFATARAPLEQVLRNVISNSVKHHDRPVGTVVVAAREHGPAWEFELRDDGPGIPGEWHERAFQMFQTLRPRDEVEGSGMGLAMVKKIVEAQGGEVWIDGEEGRGAAIRFTWLKEWRGMRRSA